MSINKESLYFGSFETEQEAIDKVKQVKLEFNIH
jgi:hypothetical protein